MQQPFDLAGQVVAITGASSGFGHHFAGVLASAGAKVVLGARRTEKLNARVEEITSKGGEAIAATLDVREKDSIASFLDTAFDQYGRLDCVINNAGVEAGAKTYHTIDETSCLVLYTALRTFLREHLYQQSQTRAGGWHEWGRWAVGAVCRCRLCRCRCRYCYCPS